MLALAGVLLVMEKYKSKVELYSPIFTGLMRWGAYCMLLTTALAWLANE
jgi:hypothetical protein